MIQKLRQYNAGERGVAYIEFALILPILLLLFVGGVELTRFVSANAKVDKASHGLANFLSTQEEPLEVSAGVLDGAFASLLSPFGTSNAGYRVLDLRPDLSSGTVDGFPLLVEEARASGAAGGTRVGAAGGPVTGADVRDIRIDRSESLVAVETYFTYRSIVPGMASALSALGLAPPNLEGEELYKRSVIRNRLANFELLEGRPATPVTPLCCGSYCDTPTGRWQPQCACFGGSTCDQIAVDSFPNCTFAGDAVCSGGGGGGGTPVDCRPNCGDAGG